MLRFHIRPSVEIARLFCSLKSSAPLRDFNNVLPKYCRYRCDCLELNEQFIRPTKPGSLLDLIHRNTEKYYTRRTKRADHHFDQNTVKTKYHLHQNNTLHKKLTQMLRHIHEFTNNTSSWKVTSYLSLAGTSLFHNPFVSVFRSEIKRFVSL